MNWKDALIREADSQVRVARFKHQGRLWNQELDCVGLVVLSLRRIGFEIEDDISYSRNPNPHNLIKKVSLLCVQIDPDAAEPGDLALCVTNSRARLPHHMGLLAPPVNNGTGLSLIHAHAESKFVQRVPYTEPWKGLTRAIYRWHQ